MSKITITFDTEKDHKTEINAAIRATDLALAIWDIEQELRNKLKHVPDTMSPETYDELMKLRDEIYCIINSRIGTIEDYTY